MTSKEKKDAASKLRARATRHWFAAATAFAAGLIGAIKTSIAARDSASWWWGFGMAALFAISGWFWLAAGGATSAAESLEKEGNRDPS